MMKTVKDTHRPVGWVDPRWLESFPLSAKTRSMVTEYSRRRGYLVEPQEGDYIAFDDSPGGSRRIGHSSRSIGFVQPGDRGSLSPFMQSTGAGSFSGSLGNGIPFWALRDSGETRKGWFKVFRDDYWTANNTIEFPCFVRVWHVCAGCELESEQ